jgi:hypothetical protein
MNTHEINRILGQDRSGWEATDFESAFADLAISVGEPTSSLLKANTKVYVIGRDGGVSEMTLGGWHNALNGGSKWDEVEITLDPAEAKNLERKWRAIAKTTEFMGNMTPEQADKTLDLIMNREDLMNLAEDYA